MYIFNNIHSKTLDICNRFSQDYSKKKYNIENNNNIYKNSFYFDQSRYNIYN